MINFSDIFKSSFLEKAASFSLTDSLIAIAFAFAVGLFIYLVYKKTFSGVMYSASFGLSLIAMSTITTLVILAVTSNVVLSLGMVGTLSIVRFRTAIKEPMDIAFLFWSIAVGIIMGAGLIPLAVIGSVIIGIILLVFANIKVRGGYSLSQTERAGSNRYSFRLNFDKYVKGQTCFGLDTLILNNMSSDYTYVKEYFAYDIMRYIGVKSPLTTFANIEVNGKTWGLYLAIEGYSKSFLERTYGTTDGQLYNVKSMDMAQGKQNGNGNAGRATGGDLVYTDDNPDNYSAIFGNAVFGESDEDNEKVLAAIKHLNDGTDLEKYFDVDQVLRYLTAQTFVVNLDSYQSNMEQNYYLYERNGKVAVLSWDYNLAFGGFQSGDAQSAINFPIDTPVSGVEMSQRPLINTLLSVPEYKEKYHEYLNDIVTGYFNSGLFEKTLKSVTSAIDTYVKNDPTAFCTYEQYNSALDAFKQFCLLRAQSVSGQLSGKIPSTTDGQKAESSALISAGGLNLSAMGSQDGNANMPQGGNRPAMPYGDAKWNKNSAKNDNQSTAAAVNSKNILAIGALGGALAIAIAIALYWPRRF